MAAGACYRPRSIAPGTRHLADTYNVSTTGSATKSAKWVESFKLRLSPELYEQAREQARREESSVSQITRYALRCYLEQTKR